MERFHLKVTLTFTFFILIPSLFLSYLALDTIKIEKEKERATRRIRTNTTVTNLAGRLGLIFREKTDVSAITERRRSEALGVEDYFEVLEAAQRGPETLFSGLFVLDRFGQVIYPAPERELGPPGPEPRWIFPRGRALHALGGFAAASLNRSLDAVEQLERDNWELFLAVDPLDRQQQIEAELRRFATLRRDPDPRISMAAARASVNILNYAERVEKALALLALYREADVSTVDLDGEPVGVDLRLRLARSLLARGAESRGEEALSALVRDLRARLPRLSLAMLRKIRGLAIKHLDEGRVERFKELSEQRIKIKEDFESLRLYFRADFDRLVTLYRALESERGAAPAKSGRDPWRADYLTRRLGENQVLAYGPLRDAGGRFLGVAGYLVDAARFKRQALQDVVRPQTSYDAEFRFTLTDRAVGQEDPVAGMLPGEDPTVRIEARLREPLDDLEVRAFRKRVVEEVALMTAEAQLSIWLIGLSMVGIFLGILATIWTVRREARAAELKTDFVANVTHELKTPLTSIRLFIETLELGHVENEEERQECLGIMARETDRLTRLIDRLLSFSRLDRKGWKFRLTYEDPTELVEEALCQLKGQRGNEKINIQVEALQQKTRVACDREAMVEVLFNLIHNAVKYTPRGERMIRVQIAERRRDVSISVIDNGSGVSRRDRRRIFRKFERGQNAEVAQIQGSGIGLTLARSIVEGHGGELNYAPNKPRGSRFVITLPR